MEEDVKILEQVRTLNKSISGGFVALIAVALHSGKSGEPTPFEWRHAVDLFDEAVKVADR